MSVALLAVLVSMATSCQKENIVETPLATTEANTVRTIHYIIDGVEHVITLYGNEEWESFMSRMMSLARQGHNVSIYDESAASQNVPTKDVQTFTTSNQSEAETWAKEMISQGYTVDMTYKDGLYICIAIR
jgi:hypothetical protein